MEELQINEIRQVIEIENLEWGFQDIEKPCLEEWHISIK
jgi:hypothetical protein